MRNLATILPWKFKLPRKFQCFNAVDGSIEMLKNNWISKISIKLKNFKTFYKAKTATRFKEIIQPSTDNSFLRLLQSWKKDLQTSSRFSTVSFATSEMELDYYHQKVNIGATSSPAHLFAIALGTRLNVGVVSRVDQLQKLGNFKKIP